MWEFPGGKCEAGETHAACLRREILEELGCDAEVGEKLLTVAHDYADRPVELHFFRCEMTGEPAPLLGQDIRWVEPRRAPRPRVSSGRRRPHSAAGWMNGVVTTVTDLAGSSPCRTSSTCPGSAEVAVNVSERDWTPEARRVDGARQAADLAPAGFEPHARQQRSFARGADHARPAASPPGPGRGAGRG